MAAKKTARKTTKKNKRISRTKRTRVRSPTTCDSPIVIEFKSKKDLQFPVAFPDILHEISYCFSVPVEKIKTAIAATHLDAGAFRAIEAMVRLHQAASHVADLERVGESFSDILKELAQYQKDPLAEFDDSTREDVLKGHIKAEFEARRNREEVQRQCIGIEEAAKSVFRSRQALEKRRREGRLLALRVKNRWMYPRWQFDAAFPSGIVPGIAQVSEHLQFSPTGTAIWLTTPSEDIEGRTPIDILRSGHIEKVIKLAEEHGQMP